MSVEFVKEEVRSLSEATEATVPRERRVDDSLVDSGQQVVKKLILRHCLRILMVSWGKSTSVWGKILPLLSLEEVGRMSSCRGWHECPGNLSLISSCIFIHTLLSGGGNHGKMVERERVSS